MLHCAFHHKIHSFMILIADSGSTVTIRPTACNSRQKESIHFINPQKR